DRCPERRRRCGALPTPPCPSDGDGLRSVDPPAPPERLSKRRCPATGWRPARRQRPVRGPASGGAARGGPLGHDRHRALRPRAAHILFHARLKPLFDTYAERAGLDLPDDVLATSPFEPPEVGELDLAAEGISTVIWTSGFRPANEWIRLPVLDELGLPRQTGG